MAAFPRFHQLTGKLPAPVAVLAGLSVAASCVLIPAPVLEGWVVASGIAAVVPAAEPPLGTTARAAMAIGGGVAVAAIVWSALYLLFGAGGLFASRLVREEGMPTVRRADAHPDCPPRWPMSAGELGTPLMEVPERPLPADLDQPLSAFDPGAIPETPIEPPVLPRAPRLEPGERMETFALATPAVSVPAPARHEPRPMGPPPSIEALLRRLEQGAARRVAHG